jgi:hypothetical protein
VSTYTRSATDTRTVRRNASALNARAKPRTGSYKVTVGYHDGFIGEGQISFAGTNAVATRLR